MLYIPGLFEQFGIYREHLFGYILYAIYGILLTIYDIFSTICGNKSFTLDQLEINVHDIVHDWKITNSMT